MKDYNRALDYTALALDSLRQGKPVLAARLLASAAKQPDLKKAIAILEASNKYAFSKIQAKAVQAGKKRLKANDEFPFEDGQGEGELAADLEDDPLDDVIEEEDEVLEADADEDDNEDDEVEEEEVTEEVVPASAVMAKVLSQMQRRKA